MKRYSDYYRAVEGYLRNYSKFQVAITNLEAEKAAKNEQLQNMPIPIAKYGADGGAGGAKLTQPEADAAQRIELHNDIRKIEHEIKEIRRMLDKVNTALDGLKPEHRHVLELRYLKELDWWRISDEMHYSAQWCREYRDNAINDMAFMMFGVKGAKELRFSFFF